MKKRRIIRQIRIICLITARKHIIRAEAGLNTAIIYGDYYYTEAIYKLKGFKELFW